MNCINMSYKGFSFYANPHSMNAHFSKKISKTRIPFIHTKAQEICENPAIISGSGCFSGKNASAQAHRLMVLFKSGGSDYLFSPLFAPVKMFFSSLELSANAEKNCIDYTFTFTEDSNAKQSSYDFCYTFALDGENLYDIANRTGVSVESLFDINEYKDLFSVSEGDRVWLK